MSFLGQFLNLDLAKEIDEALAARHRQSKHSFAYNNTADGIAQAMVDALRKDMEKAAVALPSTPSALAKIASTLICAADYLDVLNEEIAVAHLEDAIEKVTSFLNKEELVLAQNFVSLEKTADSMKENSKEVLRIVSVALVDTSDSLDKLGFEDISNHLDQAITAIAHEKCHCGGPCCN